MENPHLIIIGVLLMAILIWLIFLKINRKNENLFLDRIEALNTLINTHKLQLETRQRFLNTYDFSKYNLKEAFKIEKKIKL